MQNKIERHKDLCKQKYKKRDAQYTNLTLMQYQHLYATKLGYKSWADLRRNNEN